MTKKTSLKESFKRKKRKKDGTLGKTYEVPSVEELHEEEKYRSKWIVYASKDAKATFELYHALQKKLNEISCDMLQASLRPCYPKVHTLWDFYTHVWRPFGEVLTDMEDEGFYVKVEDLHQAQIEAEKDRKEKPRFRLFASRSVKGGEYMNPASDLQLRTLLFGGLRNKKTDKEVDARKIIKASAELVALISLYSCRLRILSTKGTWKKSEKERHRGRQCRSNFTVCGREGSVLWSPGSTQLLDGRP